MMTRCGKDSEGNDQDREENEGDVDRAGTRGRVGVNFWWHDGMGFSWAGPIPTEMARVVNEIREVF